ncbi:MAG: type II CAAX endopeptidase family protein [Cyanobacteria bacterium P01_F01_bin.33]
MKRLLWGLVLVFALAISGLLLYQSWSQPPPQTRLDLIETNMGLQAQAALDSPTYQPFAQALVGTDLLPTATKRYQAAILGLEKAIARQEAVLDSSGISVPPALKREIASQRAGLDGLRLRSGILFANQAQLANANDAWRQVQSPELKPAAQTLRAVWNGEASTIPPGGGSAIRQQLDGWFQIVSLRKLFDAQGRSEALVDLYQRERDEAIAAIQRLLLLSGATGLGLISGVILLLGWFVSRWRSRAELTALSGWHVPWEWIRGPGILALWFLAFISVAQVVPLIYSRAIGVVPADMSNVQLALSLALNYGTSAAIGLILIFSVSSQHPAKPDLLRFNLGDRWLLWGLGGYVAAFPLVTVAAVVERSLLPSSGGGNPILPILLESEGWIARAIFLTVVSVMAPIFEETMFRGFLLPSLSKVMPVWGAIALSAVLFAVAHLNLSDLLPLTVLGILLGYIYTRSRNLLAPMLLHGLWNAGSFAALLILGSAA